MSKLKKTHTELTDYMWKVYPDRPDGRQSRKNYYRRCAMLEAYDFLTGKIDQEEKEKKAIAASILKRLKEDFKK